MERHDDRHWDAVVIGAGAAGLTASIYMARRGLRVLVLKRASMPGGRGASTAMGGAMLNLGPHALYKSALPILEEVGVSPSGTSPKLNGLLVYGNSAGGHQMLPLWQLLIGPWFNWSEDGIRSCGSWRIARLRQACGYYAGCR